MTGPYKFTAACQVVHTAFLTMWSIMEWIVEASYTYNRATHTQTTPPKLFLVRVHSKNKVLFAGNRRARVGSSSQGSITVAVVRIPQSPLDDPHCRRNLKLVLDLIELQQDISLCHTQKLPLHRVLLTLISLHLIDTTITRLSTTNSDTHATLIMPRYLQPHLQIPTARRYPGAP